MFSEILLMPISPTFSASILNVGLMLVRMQLDASYAVLANEP